MLTCLFFTSLIIFIMFMGIYIDTLEEEKKRLERLLHKDDCKTMVKIYNKILEKK